MHHTGLSHVHDGTDENFAREIMQLFTIGLVKLNLDGSVQMNETTGEPIPTYSNKDVEEYARVWTGFIRQDSRGNIERNSNFIDPMRIDTRR